jgi:hypothetical protein
MGVCTHEHLTHRCSLALRLPQRGHVADGSWSVCAHEHLPDSLFSLLRLPRRQSCQQMVHGVFALMNI